MWRNCLRNWRTEPSFFLKYNCGCRFGVISVCIFTIENIACRCYQYFVKLFINVGYSKCSHSWKLPFRKFHSKGMTWKTSSNCDLSRSFMCFKDDPVINFGHFQGFISPLFSYSAFIWGLVLVKGLMSYRKLSSEIFWKVMTQL